MEGETIRTETQMSESTARVGVLGLGAIGLPIALRLAEAGFDLAVHDADPDRAAHVAGAASGADALRACDTLCVVTPDESGLLDLLGSDVETGRIQTVVLISTVVPERAREVAEVLSRHGVALVEAPVSGGPDKARAGQLAVLVGGDPAPARAVIDALAETVYPLGEVGAASAVKLANQLVLFSALGALHEGLALAAAHGVSEDAALAVLQGSTGDTWAGRHLGFFDDLTRSYDAAHASAGGRPWRKDLAEFVQAAGDARIDAGIAAAVAELAGDRIEAHAHDGGNA